LETYNICTCPHIMQVKKEYIIWLYTKKHLKGSVHLKLEPQSQRAGWQDNDLCPRTSLVTCLTAASYTELIIKHSGTPLLGNPYPSLNITAH
jgi:hypothetical protein